MKTFVRFLSAFLCVLLMASVGLAESEYLIPDSNSRRLTEAELWEWDRESLSYIFNEIMARHGYVFDPGSEYDTWFRQFSWYSPNQNPDNQAMVYNVLSDLEWINYQTIKKVAGQMDLNGETKHTAGRKCYKDLIPAAPAPAADAAAPTIPTMYGFTAVSLPAWKQLAVYSAPSYGAWRLADDRLNVGADGLVWAGGWDSGWLLVCYSAGFGSMRVGYVNSAEIGANVYGVPSLSLSYVSQMVKTPCPMTNDPMYVNTPMTWLRQGDYVLLLGTFSTYQGQTWDYVETTINGMRARGFIPHGVLVNYGS